MAEDIKTQGIPQKKLRPLLDKLRDRIRNHEVFQDTCEKYGIDESELDLVPMAFADLEVSARTDHGIIYFGLKLLDENDELTDFVEEDDHYLPHEWTHFCQQTTGSQPTRGSDSGDYLKNPEEVEGFQNQLEYIADTKGEDKAEKYVDRVLDHHDSKGKDRKEKKDKLMARAMRRNLLNRL
jgi:hypothetical protein